MSAYYPQPPPAGSPAYAYYQQIPPHPVAAAPAPPPPPGTVTYPQYISYPQPPIFASYGSSLAVSQVSFNDVRTLFVAGLPEDVKPREIYNLFREFPGYISSHLRSPTQSSQPFAFVVFSDQQSAIMAMHTLNGIVFDIEKGSTLYIDLAKSNSRSKRMRLDTDIYDGEKRARSSSKGTPDSGVGSIHIPGMVNPAHNTIGYSSAQSHHPDVGTASQNITGNIINSSSLNVSRNAPPCPTLFVANLGSTCSEEDLVQIFSRCPGFLKLKMQSPYGNPVAFVDFQDVASSTEALNNLQGAIRSITIAGEGMRLEYSIIITLYSFSLFVSIDVLQILFPDYNFLASQVLVSIELVKNKSRYAKSRMGMKKK